MNGTGVPDEHGSPPSPGTPPPDRPREALKALRIRPDAPVLSEVRRLAHGWLDWAMDHIRNPGTDRDEDLHQVRVAIKRLRSLLRLMQPVVTDRKLYRELNGRLRMLGMDLGALRDNAVIVRTLDAAETSLPRKVEREALHSLIGQQQEARTVDSPIERVMQRAEDSLTGTRERLAALAIDADGWEALEPGLEKAYRRCRKLCLKAHKTQSDHAYHQWRKWAKHLFYQLEFLCPAGDGGFFARELRHLNLLQDELGTDHDLAVARQLIEDPDTLRDRPKASRRIAKVLARKQQTRRQKSAKLAAKAFAKKPSKFLEKIRTTWLELEHGTPE